MHNLEQQKLYFKSVLHNLLKQPFVEKHVKQPFIDEDKLQLSYFLFEDQSEAWESFEKYITATALIQMAIDLHERIPVENEAKMEEVEKQLTVLVGDYFSGMYYYILSELEDIEMIQIIAKSIKGINEEKMNVYYHHIHSLDALIQSVTRIESTFYIELLRYHNKLNLVPTIQQFLLTNRLKKEQQQIIRGEFSILNRAMDFYNDKNNMNIDCYQWITDQYEQHKRTLFKLLDDMHFSETPFGKWMIECHQPHLKTTAVKEGLR